MVLSSGLCVLPHQTHPTLSLWTLYTGTQTCWNRKGGFTEQVSTAPESSICGCEACMQLLGHGNPLYEAPAAQSSNHSTTLEFTELLRTTFFSQMFVIVHCMSRCLILYTWDNGSDWNSWIQWLTGVSQYFSPYSVYTVLPSFLDLFVSV